MSNSRGSMEIMDVLSSIRRLVSEDRRADVAPRTEPVLTGPAEVQVRGAMCECVLYQGEGRGVCEWQPRDLPPSPCCLQ